MITALCLFENQYAPSSTGTIYSSPTNTVTIVDKFTATNVTSGSVNLTVYKVPSGGTAGASNEIISVVAIAGNTYVDLNLANHILNPGDFFAVLASAGSSISVTASGRQITS